MFKWVSPLWCTPELGFPDLAGATWAVDLFRFRWYFDEGTLVVVTVVVCGLQLQSLSFGSCLLPFSLAGSYVRVDKVGMALR